MTDTVRMDKWLWAARFFKTRSLAAQAVNGGKVRLNGNRAKPARALKAGDQLQIHKGGFEYSIVVLDLSERRGPASAAQALYQESEDSLRRREALQEQHRLAASTTPRPTSKPDKKARRQLRGLKW
jgi:ribosome-associated heat shock protein Hsp15